MLWPWGGIISKFDLADACIKALNAGADLLLIRDEGPIIHEVFPRLVEAVKTGELPEQRVYDAIKRILSVKYDYGFFDKKPKNGIKNPEKASNGVKKTKTSIISKKLARLAITVIRDKQNILPINRDKKILLIEQVNPLHQHINTQYCHPSILWKKMLGYSKNVGCIETLMAFREDDKERVKKRYKQAEIIIITNYYSRRHLNGNEFVKEIVNWGKPTIVISNSPFPFTVLPEYKTVIVTHGASTESMQEVAKKIFGIENKE